ncbi:hypothetical protein CNYM01_07643 [Colletotrichum nymphaeae SA-01]|uniref:Uncharacterized protein n=1 Tax=Colletotrichum nymphaeae SA-01 TaxID=1460502 RepID=A0A135UCG5_9PEZI|nr:hypothetical protein CNYM01_07643 [Colletotrichum nymphaeae SA-01]
MRDPHGRGRSARQVRNPTPEDQEKGPASKFFLPPKPDEPATGYISPPTADQVLAKPDIDIIVRRTCICRKSLRAAVPTV